MGAVNHQNMGGVSLLYTHILYTQYYIYIYQGNPCFLSKTKPVIASRFIAFSLQSMDRICRCVQWVYGSHLFFFFFKMVVELQTGPQCYNVVVGLQFAISL